MISKFFIDRPVFASVISIIIVIAGLVAMRSLPIEQYPSIVPPEVTVSATYPGASAESIASTVAAPLEQQINGVEKMLYMRSTSTGSGTLSIAVTFAIGTNPDQATINVNNRVQRALPLLPQEVQRLGVQVQKRSSSILEVIAMSSPNGRYDTIFVSNYALINVIDELRRTPGVGDAILFGAADYSMRIWLRPDKLAQYSLTPSDVAIAVREQNNQFAAGRFGEEPQRDKTAFTYRSRPRAASPIHASSRTSSSDRRVRRRAARSRTWRGSSSARATIRSTPPSTAAPAVPIGIFLQPGANAIQVTKEVKNVMERLSQRFPEDLKYDIPFTTTRFVEVSIEEVIMTFIEAIILVVLVIFLFLQNVRATIIPVLALPVSIIGTFAGMYALGFSINLLTLFGLVLAIGIVVDDAIVVLENIERIMRTEHLPAREAAIKAMTQVSGPIVAIVLALCAVFIPVSFLGGLAGELYRQFAVTISVSVMISGIVALTLTPALGAIFLQQKHGEVAAPFRVFNRGFDWLTLRFTQVVGYFLKHTFQSLAIVAAMLAVTAFMFFRVPGGLLPDEDQGYNMLVTMLPPASSLERSRNVAKTVIEGVRKNPAVENVVLDRRLRRAVVRAEDPSAVAFVTLKDWSERKDPAQDARNTARAFGALNMSFRDGIMFGINPPPIQGISMTGGFELYLQDRSGGTLDALVDRRQQGRRRSQPAAGIARRADAVLHRRAAVPHDRRPRQGEDARRAADVDLRHHAERVRLALRQRLHAVSAARSASACRRSPTSAARRTTCASSTSDPRPARWCRSTRWFRPSASSARTRSTASTSSRRRRSWATLRRASRRDRRWPRSRRSCRRSCLLTTRSAGPARPSRKCRPRAPAIRASCSA